MKTITLVNPQLVLSKKDIFTTGIVYMPAGLAYFAGTLAKNGYNVSVVDAFGENPNCISEENGFILRGLPPADVCEKIDKESSAVFIYAGTLVSHRSTISIIKACKSLLKAIPVIVMENSQAATAYSLYQVHEEFYGAGADFILTGEPEQRGLKLLDSIFSGSQTPDIDGIGFLKEGKPHYLKPADCIRDLDALPFPAWERFPVQNYWDLNYAHGPLSSGKYLPVITSRGCPYSCGFCVVPGTNSMQWRKRSASNVVDEITYLKKRFGVTEFHIEDLNPTVDDERTKNICEEIISRDLNIIWKICAGTKVETIKSAETIALMAKSGCRYISISPESGSERLMKLMNKPFDYEYSIKMAGEAKKCGIYLQACFVLGYPGETSEDREKSAAFVKRFVKAGVDEIAIFIITPVPGSRLFGEIKGYSGLSELNFSPAWRADYKELNAFRMKLYKKFMLWKLAFHPFKLLRQPLSFLTGSFNTKMEMAPYRAIHTFFLLLFAKRCNK